MKTKEQKRNEARKTAEATKAARKAQRQQKTGLSMGSQRGPKGKSLVPQSKTGAKKK